MSASAGVAAAAYEGLRPSLVVPGAQIFHAGGVDLLQLYIMHIIGVTSGQAPRRKACFVP
jgi:hypothetical protein